MKRTFRRTLAVLPAGAAAAMAAALFAAALSASLSSCARKTAQETRPPLAVATAAVEKRDFAIAAEYAARLAPRSEVNILSKVSGRVASVRADVGDAVSSGQILFTIDASDYDAQYRQAKAAYQSAGAVLTRTSDSGQDQQIIQAQSAADAAQVGYDNAKSLYDKTKSLYDGGAIPKQQLDDVQARFKAAGIQLDSARQNLALVRDKSGPQSNDVAAGQRDQAKAQLDFAKSQLDATVVRSPLKGKISYRNVEKGELVGPSSLAFVVIDDSAIYADADVSERVIGRLRAGLVLALTVDALGGGAFSGVIDSVSPAADPRTMLYRVRVRLDNAGGLLRPGMLARIRVPLTEEPDALLLPEKAVFSSGGGDAVYVVEGGRARLKSVVLGDSDGSCVQIRQGLAEGDVVVSEGQEFLTDGDAVTTK